MTQWKYTRESMMLREFDVLRGRHIERLKVGWHIDECGYIGGFGRFGGKPGNGAIAMRHICLLSSKWNIGLSLHADNERLVEWYSQFDFVRPFDGRQMYRSIYPWNWRDKDVKAFARWTDNVLDVYHMAKMRHYREHPDPEGENYV
jgi:hypothetical protein